MAEAGQPVTIVIEKIVGQNVQAILAEGAYLHAKASWGRILGKAEKDKVVFLIGSQKYKLTLRLRKENSAIGEWDEGGLYWKALLDRKAWIPALARSGQDSTETKPGTMQPPVTSGSNN